MRAGASESSFLPPASDSAWSPLPRGWVPPPGPGHRDPAPERPVGSGPAPGPEARPIPGQRPAPGHGTASGQRSASASGDGTAVAPRPAPGNGNTGPRSDAPANSPFPPASGGAPTSSPPDSHPAWTPVSPVSPVSPPDFSASAGPDPALSWSAPLAPGGAPGATRPVVSFAEPEGFGEPVRQGMGARQRAVVAAACVVLGLGLIGGAVTGSWLVGDSADAAERTSYATAGGLWHNVPVDDLFPRTVDGQGAGPGGADRTWTRIGVAPDGDCAAALDPLLRTALAPVGCRRLLRATYTDATQSYVTTVGLLFTTADATAMRALDARFTKEGLAKRTDLMPRPYAVKGTVAAGFGDKQRASWTISVLTDAPVVVYTVSGWADGRAVDTPQPAAEATASGATTAPGQAGLGHEAQGLADRVERGLRRTAASPSPEQS
ncbi:hypothetical protein SAMN02745830_02403 [Streptomyces sp. Amel2xC10]|nr:hypothetical protein SAMN02745830_02403 [Streptomyces sp. Amel2xC10]